MSEAYSGGLRYDFAFDVNRKEGKLFTIALVSAHFVLGGNETTEPKSRVRSDRAAPSIARFADCSGGAELWHCEHVVGPVQLVWQITLHEERATSYVVITPATGRLEEHGQTNMSDLGCLEVPGAQRWGSEPRLVARTFPAVA